MTQQRKRAGWSRQRRSGSERMPAALSWARERGELMAVGAYLAILSLFGGGLVGWTPGIIVAVAATIVFAVAAAWRDGFVSLARASLAGRAALVGVAVLPFVQILPIPPEMWWALPGQDLRRAALTLVGAADSWQPLSVEPVSTALIAVLAAGFTALVAMLLRLSDVDFRRALRIVFILSLLGIAAGLLQVASGGQFPQPQIDNPEANMLGFYANKNHMALAIASSILLFGLVISRDAMAPNKRRFAVAGYAAFALICIVTTNSRAGLGLGVLAFAIVLADLARGVPLRYRIAAVVGMGALVAVVLSSSAFETVSDRVEDVGSDLRWRIASWSLPLAERYWLFGGGAGTYKTLFQANEELAWVKPTYVNAAHDDYLQLIIETGLPGCALLLLLIVSVASQARTVRALPRRDPRRREAMFGYAVLLLFALHSAVDYPLRRPAEWTLFAIALAAVYRARDVGAGTAARSANMARSEAA